MASRLPYTYTPLPARGFLRLLSHLYKDPQGTIHGKLIVAPLNPAPPYVALSYTWGSPYPRPHDQPPDTEAAQLNKELVVDGKRLAITQNLLAYLDLHASSDMEESETPDFWIDAICINQGDNAEKAQQVSQMHTIYRASSAVLVWLGPADEYTADAVEFIARIGSIETENNFRETLRKVPSQDIVDALGDLAHSKRHWEAVYEFFFREWFQRIWIIQEIVLAPDIFVLIGTTEVEWSHMQRAAEFIPKYIHHTGIEFNAIFTSFMVTLNILTGMYGDMQGRLHLGYMLPQIRMFQCGNPRDKVYAAFGWTMLSRALGEGPGCERENKVTNEVLRVDYDEPAPVTYTRVIKHIYEEDRVLDPMMCARHPDSPFASQLPSWVPDLSAGSAMVDTVGMAFGHFTATRRSEAIVFKSAETGLLETMGQQVDRVSTVRILEPANKRRVGVGAHVGLERLLLTIHASLEVMAAVCNGLAQPDTALLGTVFDVLTQGRQGFPQIEALSAADGGAFLWNSFLYYAAYAHESSPNTEAVAQLHSLTDKVASMLFDNENETTKEAPLEEPTVAGCTLADLRSDFPNQALFVTEKGRIGIGCYDIVQGDAVWLVPGLRQPLAFRACELNGRYRSLGRCYVAGLMEGEGFEPETLVRVTLE